MGVEGRCSRSMKSGFESFLLSPTMTLDSPKYNGMSKMEALSPTFAASVSPVRTMSETQR